MDTYQIKKTMIETAVDQGIRLVEQDPERSLRRLADMGRHFSKSRFQVMMFNIIQSLLSREDSAYYTMISNMLKNCDHESLCRFGVNLAYTSWSHGAERIREQQPRLGCCLPWASLVRYDSDDDGTGVGHLTRLIQEGQTLGQYLYVIRETAGTDESCRLPELFSQYRECAFLWLRKSGRLSSAQIQLLHQCQETIVILPMDNPDTPATAAELMEHKLLFGLYREYDIDEKEPSAALTEGRQELLNGQTAFVMLLQKDGSTASASRYVYDSRLEQQMPFILTDCYGDGRLLSDILCGHTNLLELDTDGTVIQPAASKGRSFPFDLPLPQAMQQIMPAYPVSS